MGKTYVKLINVQSEILSFPCIRNNQGSFITNVYKYLLKNSRPF